jgi:hypothetical protein
LSKLLGTIQHEDTNQVLLLFLGRMAAFFVICQSTTNNITFQQVSPYSSKRLQLFSCQVETLDGFLRGQNNKEIKLLMIALR